MRRLIVGMSQSDLGDPLGVTFQQIQKYEKGTNRIGASRLQHIAQLLHVPVSFFFEGGPEVQSDDDNHETIAAPSPTIISEFVASADGLNLSKAFMRVKSRKLKRSIVDLVEKIADR